jgi:hypothetical protein
LLKVLRSDKFCVRRKIALLAGEDEVSGEL